MIELAVGQTGIRTAFFVNAEQRVQSSCMIDDAYVRDQLSLLSEYIATGETHLWRICQMRLNCCQTYPAITQFAVDFFGLAS